MQILIAGGTGFIGRHLARELVDRDHDVTALARNPDPDVLPDSVTSVEGDVTDPDSLNSAFEGQDAVVNLVSLSPLFKPKGGDEQHDRIHRQGTQNCLAAAESAGVGRFLQLSALGADPDGPTHYIRAKGRAETLVRESTLDWTIVRPSVVFGEGDEFVGFTKRLKRMFAPGLPLYPLPGGGDKTRFQPIHVGDFVPILAACLEDAAHSGQTYEIGGPEVLTLREVTNLVYEAEGKSISIVPLPMALSKLGLTVMDVTPRVPLGRDQYRSLQFDNTVSENDIAIFGVDESELLTLGAYLGREQ